MVVLHTLYLYFIASKVINWYYEFIHIHHQNLFAWRSRVLCSSCGEFDSKIWNDYSSMIYNPLDIDGRLSDAKTYTHCITKLYKNTVMWYALNWNVSDIWSHNKFYTHSQAKFIIITVTLYAQSEMLWWFLTYPLLCRIHIRLCNINHNEHGGYEQHIKHILAIIFARTLVQNKYIIYPT